MKQKGKFFTKIGCKFSTKKQRKYVFYKIMKNAANSQKKNFLTRQKIENQDKLSQFSKILKNDIKIFFKIILDKIFRLC